MFRSLRTQFIAISVSIVVVAVAIVAVSNYVTTRHYVLESVDQQTVGVAKHSASGIADWIEAKRAATAAIKDTATLQDPVPLLKTLEQAGQFDMTYIARPDKSALFSQQRKRAADYDPTKRAWYISAAESGKPIISAPYIGASNGKLLITFADPIGTPGKIEAVVGADILLDTVINNVLIVKPTPHSFAFLVDGTGKIIAHPDQSMTLQPLTRLNAALTAEKLTELARAQHSSEVRFGDRDAMLYVTPVRGSDWMLAVALDRQEATASLAAILTSSVIEALVLVVLSAALLFVLITRSITRPLGQAVTLAQTVASGDLTSHIEVRATNEVGHLLQALKDMNGSLVKIVGEVRTGTETIATAATELASGNLDLSSRTEQQAGSLAETASSIDELTATVKQNADNARQANQLTIIASDVAEKGGAVVSAVVDTMHSINESSNRIVEIIGVIDGIAFQTNILALNAAVEAARAGEQGRGFAVVASEVRSLAQRSASAAKEIKTLIDNSVGKVHAGTELVGQAGATMGEIVDSVRRVTDIMSEITAASEEQTDGIDQINRAVGQMDSVTQQNASLVEEAVTAVESLQGQAASLKQIVGVFRLDAAAAAPGIAPPAKKTVTLTAAAPLTPKPAAVPVTTAAPAALKKPGLAPVAKVASAPAAPAAPIASAAPAPVKPRAIKAVPDSGDDWETF